MGRVTPPPAHSSPSESFIPAVGIWQAPRWHRDTGVSRHGPLSLWGMEAQEGRGRVVPVHRGSSVEERMNECTNSGNHPQAPRMKKVPTLKKKYLQTVRHSP